MVNVCMKKIYDEDNEDITGGKLCELMDFVIKRSNFISVFRYCTGFLDVSEFKQMQEAYQEYIYKEDEGRREAYQSNRNNYLCRLHSILHLKRGMLPIYILTNYWSRI